MNVTLVLLHWRVGKRILPDILKEKRAGYGEKTLLSVARQMEMITLMIPYGENQAQ